MRCYARSRVASAMPTTPFWHACLRSSPQPTSCHRKVVLVPMMVSISPPKATTCWANTMPKSCSACCTPHPSLHLATTLPIPRSATTYPDVAPTPTKDMASTLHPTVRNTSLQAHFLEAQKGNYYLTSAQKVEAGRPSPFTRLARVKGCQA